jgi:hypothetical protein
VRLVRLGEGGEVGFHHPSSKLVNRCWENVPLQSGELEDPVVRVGECGPSRILAVPSSSSVASPSDCCMKASFLMVDSEGSTDDVLETERELDRLYHSSGTQNLKQRRAEEENGFSVKGNVRTLATIEDGGSLENSGTKMSVIGSAKGTRV